MIRNVFPTRGGALSCENNGTLHLTHCTFTNNAVFNDGGAIGASQLLNGVVKSTAFLNNTAEYGGAIFSQVGHLTQFKIQGCTFRRNRASRFGGALYFNTTSAKILDSELSENESPHAGTIMFSGKSCRVHITRSTIGKSNIGRSRNSYGAAVLVAESEKVVTSSVTFCDNNIGGLFLSETRGEIHNCTFSRNQGYIGAIRAEGSKVLLVTNTSLSDNGNAIAPTMSLSNKNTLIQNCTFVVSRDSNNAMGIQFEATYHPILRSYGNVFSMTHVKVSVQMKQLFFLFSSSPKASSVTFYFWDTWYQVNSSKPLALDRDFMHNKSTVDIATGSHMNVSAEFSQFASGKFHV